MKKTNPTKNDDQDSKFWKFGLNLVIQKSFMLVKVFVIMFLNPCFKNKIKSCIIN